MTAGEVHRAVHDPAVPEVREPRHDVAREPGRCRSRPGRAAPRRRRRRSRSGPSRRACCRRPAPARARTPRRRARPRSTCSSSSAVRRRRRLAPGAPGSPGAPCRSTRPGRCRRRRSATLARHQRRTPATWPGARAVKTSRQRVVRAARRPAPGSARTSWHADEVAEDRAGCPGSRPRSSPTARTCSGTVIDVGDSWTWCCLLLRAPERPAERHVVQAEHVERGHGRGHEAHAPTPTARSRRS